MSEPLRRDLRERLERLASEMLARHGATAQVQQAQEECAELIAAISHARRRKPGATAELVGEIVDVLFLSEQMRQLFAALVEREMTKKLDEIEAGLGGGDD